MATLTSELCNGRWACLSTGMELVLDCGIWDVLRIVDVTGADMMAGCILDQDVTVELETALDTPVSSVGTVSTVDISGSILSSGGAMSFPNMIAATPQRDGYIPFSGTGNRLSN